MADVTTLEDAQRALQETDAEFVTVGLVDTQGLLRGKYVSRPRFERSLPRLMRSFRPWKNSYSPNALASTRVSFSLSVTSAAIDTGFGMFVGASTAAGLFCPISVYVPFG